MLWRSDIHLAVAEPGAVSGKPAALCASPMTAEDTGIFHPGYNFTPTVDRMSDVQSANTHEVIGNCR